MTRSTTMRAGSTKTGLPSFSTADPVTRRRFLAAAGGGAAGLAFVLGPAPDAYAKTGRVPSDPFALGVASGDPKPTSVLLWARLTCEPLSADGGLDLNAKYEVEWEVASDERFRKRAAHGRAVATAADNFSVHVEATGLRPGRQYWYRFRCGRYLSPTGRTRTAPAPGDTPDLKFGFASCMNYRAGYFQTMADAVEQDLDLMLFLGDYIYEYSVSQIDPGRPIPTDLPAEVVPETETLEQYRLRYALYKLDPDLQAAHQAMPWAVTWDDHEVENDYETDHRDALERRAAAYRAYWENMPLARPQKPRGVDARIYRRLSWGRMAQFDILDTRQYRDPETAISPAPEEDAERLDPARTILGDRQEQWLAEGLGAHRARWNFVGQQLLMARLNTASAEGEPTVFSPGTWDGYQASQQRLFDLVSDGLESGRVRNFCALGGDVHCSYVSDLISDSRDPSSPLIGTDITSPSITSARDFNPEANERRQIRRVMNESLHWADLHCGYDVCTVTRDQARFDVRVVDKVSLHDSPLFTGATFTVQDQVPGYATD